MSSRFSRSLVAVALSLIALGAAPASAQVTLKRVLPTDTKISSSSDTTTEQVLTLAGMNIESKSEQNAVNVATFSAPKDGKISVGHKVESLQLRIKAQGMEYSFDSANPDKGDDSEVGRQIAGGLKATLKAAWTSIHDMSGKVLEIEGLDKLAEGLDANAAAAVKSQLSKDYLIERLQHDIERIPNKPLKVGDTWDVTNNFRIGGGQTLIFKQQYKYAGVTDKDGKKLHRIEFTSKEVTYEINADSPLPLKLKNSDLKVANSKGELLFDNERGRAVEENEKVQIKGKITFDLGGQELPGELDLTITTNTKERS